MSESRGSGCGRCRATASVSFVSFDQVSVFFSLSPSPRSQLDRAQTAAAVTQVNIGRTWQRVFKIYGQF